VWLQKTRGEQDLPEGAAGALDACLLRLREPSPCLRVPHVCACRPCGCRSAHELQHRLSGMPCRSPAVPRAPFAVCLTPASVAKQAH
jgi:hypothetical protein